MKNINDMAQILADACFLFLGLNFFWGLYCVILLWRRTGQLRFKRTQDQEDFVDEVVHLLNSGDHQGAIEMCEGRVQKALPRLILTAVMNRKQTMDQIRNLIGEMIQRELMASLENKMSWIATTIRSAPLLGLFGTVLGMMAAFGRIGGGEKVQPAVIAKDISIALICTAMGLATAIPFGYLLSNLSIKVKTLMEATTGGMTRIMECLQHPTKSRSNA